MGETALRLDANEGRPARVPSSVPGFLDSETARRYPDARPLEALIAARLGIAPERVVVTAGGDDAIDRAVRALAPPGSILLGTEPAFVEYEAAAERSRVRYVPLPRPPASAFPVRAMAEAALELRPALLVAASPDNPGGGTISLPELEALAGLGVPLLFDSAYSEFASDQEVYRAALSIPHCIRVGSFSKAYGLAGLRVGWAAASPENAAAIRWAGPPFSVASTSLAAAAAALTEGQATLALRIARVRRERDRLVALLSELGASTWPGEANFAAARVRDAEGLAARLSERGVLVRTWPGRPACAGLVRITCPADREEFGRLARALRAGKECI